MTGCYLLAFHRLVHSIKFREFTSRSEKATAADAAVCGTFSNKYFETKLITIQM
jgi:hypothetical protein